MHECICLSFPLIERTKHSQVSDPSLPDSSRDGFHSCADGVEQVCQLTCPVGLPALLQDEPGEGLHVGVEGSSVRHCLLSGVGLGPDALSEK